MRNQLLTLNLEQSIKQVVDIQNLNHFFGEGKLRKQILFDIDLVLNSGEVIILKGPSGSGKTTLLTLMGGLRSPQSGSLKVFGEELVGANKNKLVETRRNIGYIFQAHNLLASLTAKQNVQMSLELHDGIKKAEVEQRAIALLTKEIERAGTTMIKIAYGWKDISLFAM